MRKNQRVERLLRSQQDQTRTPSRPPATITRHIYLGEVADVNDPLNQGRIKVYVQRLDGINKVEALPWCSKLFATNIQHQPKIGEFVAIVLENAWITDRGRWWLGPIYNSRITDIPLDAVSMSARKNNSVVLYDDKGVRITTDVTEDQPEVEMVLDALLSESRIKGNDIVLDSYLGRNGIEYAVPYGERLVQLLKFMLKAMLTHSHPPNTPPTPEDWTRKAIDYIAEIDDWLINKNVRTRGPGQSRILGEE